MKILIPCLLLLLAGCKGKRTTVPSHHQNLRSGEVVNSYKMSYKDRQEKERLERLLVLNVSEEQFYFDSTVVTLSGEKFLNRAVISFEFDLSDSVEIPRVRFGRGGHNHTTSVSKIAINAIIKDSEIGEVSRFKQRGSFSSYRNKGKVDLEIGPEEFRKLKVGKHTVLLEIDTHFESIHGDESKIHPYKCKVEFEIEISPIFCSTVYFSSVELNEDLVIKKLGSDNDYNDATPEACIKIRWEGQTLVYGHSSNSFKYSEKKRAKFYHNSLDDSLRIEIRDADYFLNSDDYINHRYASIDSLIDKSYKSVPLYMADKLMLYCTTEGQINK